MELQILFLIVFVSSTLAADDVLVFTDSNFQTGVVKHPVLLVKFYAPWCGHCKNLAPEFERAASILKRSDTSVSLAKVDCTVETSTCSKFGVNGYPTLKIFKNGEFSKDYDGARETDEIVLNMNKESGPVSRELLTLEDANNFLSKDSVGVIGFFYSDMGSEAKTFIKVADQLSYLRFAHTTSSEVKKELNQTQQAVVLFRPKVLQSQFEEALVRTTDIGAARLKAFLEAEAFGLCAERHQGNAAYFPKPLVVAYYDVDYFRNPKGTNYWRNRVMKIGKKVKNEGGKIYFAISNIDEMLRELDECGIEDRGGDRPVVCAWDSKNKRFRMEEEFSMEAFEQFVRDFLAGKVRQYIKSEPAPVFNDDPVKIVVADNFDEIVNDEEKDVLIEFYAPWCGHCKSLAPKYEELARKLKNEKELVIAQMDATANDVPPPYEVSGFPTIYFAGKDRKSSPKLYEGDSEMTDLLKFVAKEATNTLSDYDRDGNKKPKKEKEKKKKTEEDKSEKKTEL